MNVEKHKEDFDNLILVW